MCLRIALYITALLAMCGCSKTTELSSVISATADFTVRMINIQDDLVVYEVMHNLEESPTTKTQRDLYEKIDKYLFQLGCVGDAIEDVNDIRGRVWMPANKNNAWWMRFKPNHKATQAVTKVDFYKDGNVFAVIEFKVKPSDEELKDAGDTCCFLAEGFGRTSLPQGLHLAAMSDTTYKLILK